MIQLIQLILELVGKCDTEKSPGLWTNCKMQLLTPRSTSPVLESTSQMIKCPSLFMVGASRKAILRGTEI